MISAGRTGHLDGASTGYALTSLKPPRGSKPIFLYTNQTGDNGRDEMRYKVLGCSKSAEKHT